MNEVAKLKIKLVVFKAWLKLNKRMTIELIIKHVPHGFKDSTIENLEFHQKIPVFSRYRYDLQEQWPIWNF